MASRGEGFGLPLTEAMAHQRYVLARDLAVFREQELPNIMFLRDDQPASLGENLMELLRDGSTGSQTKFTLPTWSEAVDGLLASLGLTQDDSVTVARVSRTH